MNITLHNFGNFKLDGGAMFGPVPKPVWEQLIIPDQQNRILMASNTLIIESEERRILIDLGMGANFTTTLSERYEVEPRNEVINPESITDIILTHLHFDHTGGLFKNLSTGAVANYSNAVYYVQKSHWEAAHQPSLKERNSFEKSDLEFLAKNKLILIDGEKEILPNIHARLSSGHTKNLQWLLINSNNRQVAFVSDLIPTASHINLSYHMSYDLNAELLLNEKQRFLEEAVTNNYDVIFQHDPIKPIGKICKVNNKYRYARLYD